MDEKVGAFFPAVLTRTAMIQNVFVLKANVSMNYGGIELLTPVQTWTCLDPNRVFSPPQ